MSALHLPPGTENSAAKWEVPLGQGVPIHSDPVKVEAWKVRDGDGWLVTVEWAGSMTRRAIRPSLREALEHATGAACEDMLEALL